MPACPTTRPAASKASVLRGAEPHPALLLDEVGMEFERREAHTRDGRVGYYEAGAGPRAVVCRHGWPRAPRVWFNVLAATRPARSERHPVESAHD